MAAEPAALMGSGKPSIRDPADACADGDVMLEDDAAAAQQKKQELRRHNSLAQRKFRERQKKQKEATQSQMTELLLENAALKQQIAALEKQLALLTGATTAAPIPRRATGTAAAPVYLPQGMVQSQQVHTGAPSQGVAAPGCPKLGLPVLPSTLLDGPKSPMSNLLAQLVSTPPSDLSEGDVANFLPPFTQLPADSTLLPASGSGLLAAYGPASNSDAAAANAPASCSGAAAPGAPSLPAALQNAAAAATAAADGVDPAALTGVEGVSRRLWGQYVQQLLAALGAVDAGSAGAMGELAVLVDRWADMSLCLSLAAPELLARLLEEPCAPEGFWQLIMTTPALHLDAGQGVALARALQEYTRCVSAINTERRGVCHTLLATVPTHLPTLHQACQNSSTARRCLQQLEANIKNEHSMLANFSAALLTKVLSKAQLARLTVMAWPHYPDALAVAAVLLQHLQQEGLALQ